MKLIALADFRGAPIEMGTTGSAFGAADLIQPCGDLTHFVKENFGSTAIINTGPFGKGNFITLEIKDQEIIKIEQHRR
jgi:Icc-related predicted phosphoesterase